MTSRSYLHVYSLPSLAPSSLTIATMSVVITACLGEVGTGEELGKKRCQFVWSVLMISLAINHLVSIPVEGKVLAILADRCNYESLVTFLHRDDTHLHIKHRYSHSRHTLSWNKNVILFCFFHLPNYCCFQDWGDSRVISPQNPLSGQYGDD